MKWNLMAAIDIVSSWLLCEIAHVWRRAEVERSLIVIDVFIIV